MPADSWPAVLQRVEPEVGELGDVLAGGPDAEDAAGVLGSAVLRVEIVGQTAHLRAARGRSLRAHLAPQPTRRPRWDGDGGSLTARVRSRLARLRSSRASARQTRSNSARCRPSLAPCARVSGSSTPVTRIAASGNSSANCAMNGIEPPTPMSTGCDAVPGLAEGRPCQRRTPGRSRRPRTARRCRRRLTVTCAPQGAWASRCVAQVAQRLGGVVAGGEPEADLGPGHREQRVARIGDAGGVEGEDGDRRLGPEPVDDRAGAHELDTVERSRTRPGAGRPGSRGRRPCPLTRPSTATLPCVVVQRREQPAQGRERVGDHAAPHAGVDGVVERADLDDAVDQPAQRGRSARARRCPSWWSRRSR